MRQIVPSFDGTKLYCIHHRGENPLTLVFLHGVGANWTVWKKEIEYFQRQGFSTLALDLRGHGLSEAPEEKKKYQMSNFTRDVYEVLQAGNIHKFCLIGHSFGGAVALNYCLLYKKKYPRSLVMVESSSSYPFKHNRLFNLPTLITKTVRFLVAHPIREQVNSWYHHFSRWHEVDLSVQGIRAEVHILQHLLYLTPLRSMVHTLDNAERYVRENRSMIYNTLQHLNLPTLIIAGEKDKIIPPYHSKLVKRLHKNAELKIIEGAKHRAIVKDCRQVSLLIHSFLSEHNLRD
ncbi:MAG: alpha/beta hydrolase [Nanoarchaeota archaeon]